MHPRTIWAIARKDALDLLQNRSTLGGLLFPIVLSLVWQLIINVLGNRTTPILVYNPGSSNVVPAVMAAFPNPEVTDAGSAAEVAAAFDLNGAAHEGARCAVGLAVPADLDDSLRSGAHPQLQLYLDESKVDAQMEAVVQAAIVGYGRALANVPPPLDLKTTVINSRPTREAAVEMRGVYIPLAVLLSFIVGTSFVPQLLVEEKEKKTLRMLMVSPASFEDILLGKLLVVLAYQLVLTGVVLAIMGAFTGQVALVVLYAVLGGCFSLALGLLLGAVLNTVSAATAAAGPVMISYILAGLFVGPLGQLLGNTPASWVAKALPTYYIAEGGVYNASQHLGSLAATCST